MPWTNLCELTELEEDGGKYVEIGGLAIAVFLHAGKVHAMDNSCPHAGANLAGGYIEQGCIVCPKHNWPFRLEDGQLRDTPGVNVDVYPVRLLEEEGQAIIVQIDLP